MWISRWGKDNGLIFASIIAAIVVAWLWFWQWDDIANLNFGPNFLIQLFLISAGFVTPLVTSSGKRRILGRAFSGIFLLAAVLASFVNEAESQRKGDADAQDIEAGTRQRDSISKQLDTVIVKLDTQNKQLEPFLVAAKNRHPEMRTDSALAHLVEDMSHNLVDFGEKLGETQPKLVKYDEKKEYEKESGLLRTELYFKSQANPPSVTVDIEITFVFGSPFEKAEVRPAECHQQFDSDTLIIHPNLRGWTYCPEQLQIGCSIVIVTWSKEPLTWVNKTISPGDGRSSRPGSRPLGKEGFIPHAKKLSDSS